VQPARRLTDGNGQFVVGKEYIVKIALK